MSFPSPFYRWRPHPGMDWRSAKPPHIVYAYIEITPFDLVKYEIDKTTGYIRVDRPQRTLRTADALRFILAPTVAPGSCPLPEAERGDGDSTGHLRHQRKATHPRRGDPDARVIGGLQAIDEGKQTTRSSPSWTTMSFGRRSRTFPNCPHPGRAAAALL